MLRLSRPSSVFALVATVTGAALVACSSFSSGTGGAGGEDGGTDGAVPVIDGSATADGSEADAAADAGPCDLSKSFGDVTEVPGVNSGMGDYAAWLTPDEKTIYFTTQREAGMDHIYRATRSDPGATFGTVGLAQLANVTTVDAHPTLAPDESWMFFTRGGAPRQIYYAPKVAGQFVPNVATGPVNSSYDDIEPFYVSATGYLFFSSTRDGPYNLYRADVTVADGGTGPGSSALNTINTAGKNTFAPVASADGLTLYFASDRDVGANKSVIYSATRPNTGAAFGNVAQLTSIAAPSAYDDRPNWVSPDHCRLYFTSTRSGVGRIYFASRP